MMARRPPVPPQPKPPAMQFYVRDWLVSTVGMPLEAKGLHIDLLCIAWDKGPLPDDPQWRQRVAGVSAEAAGALWAILAPRWKKTRAGWINPRLERQRRERDDYRARAVHAARMRWASTEQDLEHPSGIPRASAARMLNRSTSSSSSTSKDPDQDPRVPRAEISTVRQQLKAAIHGWLDLEPEIPEGELAERVKALGRPLRFTWNTGREIGALIDSVRAEREKRSRRRA
jgi:uncharacterized protein YdaU (DUF1376 family)